MYISPIRSDATRASAMLFVKVYVFGRTPTKDGVRLSAMLSSKALHKAWEWQTNWRHVLHHVEKLLRLEVGRIYNFLHTFPRVGKDVKSCTTSNLLVWAYAVETCTIATPFFNFRQKSSTCRTTRTFISTAILPNGKYEDIIEINAHLIFSLNFTVAATWKTMLTLPDCKI